MIAVFDNIESAMLFDAAVSEMLGLPNAESKTDRYGEPIKHKTKDLWALPIEPCAEALVPEDAVLIELLTEDWFTESS